mmetsp:Transcript_7583/g.14219  ORF Transcript_7583/g.14219 Transcript_7583/m.14219 type:complete len:212 (-) Transcript_7583:159-794(-)
MAKGLSREETSKALTLVKSLEAQEDSYEFLRPVDFKGLGLSDYPLIVTKPMDLSTVRKKIKAQKYDSLVDIVADLQLIWENAKLYNPADSLVHTQAVTMETHMRRLNNKLGVTAVPRESRKRARDEDGISASEVVSFEEKWEVTEQIKKLNHDTLLSMVTICREHCPRAVKELEADKVQITIDDLDRATFNLLKELVYSPEEGAPTKRARR